jgi:O-antigen ligase
VAVWEWTFDFASTRPLGGGFDAYRGNSFTYTMPVRKVDGNTTSIEYREVTDKARAYHSSIFEMLGEQGWPGLIMWLSLQAVGLFQMEVLQRRWRKADTEATRWIAPFAAALQMGAVIYLVGATFQGIAYQPVMLMLVGLQVGLHTYCRRLDSARATLARSTAQRPAIAAKPGGAVAA